MAELVFDEEAHAYSYDGIHVPSVTQVIESVLDSFSKVPKGILKKAQAIGTAVHEATALYDLDDLDGDSLDPIIEPYLRAWSDFRASFSFSPDEIEERVFHPTKIYAGTYDRVGMITLGKKRLRALVDIKSGALMASANIQSAAYVAARDRGRNLKDKIQARLIVNLRKDGTFGVHECVDPNDERVFFAALTLHQWKVRHNIT